MFNNVLNFFIKDFLTPVGVSVFVLVITQILSYFSANKEKKEKKYVIIDKVLNTLTSLKQASDKLIFDSRNNYFDLYNRDHAVNSLNALQRYSDEIYLISSSKNITEILNLTEEFKELMGEIADLENLSYTKNKELQEVDNFTNSEINQIRLKASEDNYSVNTTNFMISPGIASPLDKRPDFIISEKLNALQFWLNDVKSRRDSKVKEINALNEDLKDRRQHFAVRLTGVQVKISKIISDLELEKR